MGKKMITEISSTKKKLKLRWKRIIATLGTLIALLSVGAKTIGDIKHEHFINNSSITEIAGNNNSMTHDNLSYFTIEGKSIADLEKEYEKLLSKYDHANESEKAEINKEGNKIIKNESLLYLMSRILGEKGIRAKDINMPKDIEKTGIEVWYTDDNYKDIDGKTIQDNHYYIKIGKTTYEFVNDNKTAHQNFYKTVINLGNADKELLKFDGEEHKNLPKVLERLKKLADSKIPKIKVVHSKGKSK